jgi:ribonuclease BN (tRNA processing enzyme)
MEIEFIGTGSGLNSALGNTSFLVRNGTDRTLLVDCGFTVPGELIKRNKLKDITDIVITHIHDDHMCGLMGAGWMNHFGYKRREEKRPNLYLGTDKMAHVLWEDSLKGVMLEMQDDDNNPFNATLDTFYNVHIGKRIEIPGIPGINLFDTLHVKRKENYGLEFDNGIFYSGDSIQLPKIDARIIFQDCQFYETKSDVHISYDKLKRELSPETKARTYLVHLGGGWDKKDPKADGFAGFVKPGDKYEF